MPIYLQLADSAIVTTVHVSVTDNTFAYGRKMINVLLIYKQTRGRHFYCSFRAGDLIGIMLQQE